MILTHFRFIQFYFARETNLFFAQHKKLHIDLVLIDLRLHAMNKTVLKGSRDYSIGLMHSINLYDLREAADFEEIQRKAIE